MMPTWMMVDKIVHDLEVLRRVAAEEGGNGAVAEALAEAGASVGNLTLASDEDAIRLAWRAIDRAGTAVSHAARISSSLSRNAPNARPQNPSR
jgi:hypothetical protein